MSTTPPLLIVIATYNEIDNLPRLIDQLFQLIPEVSVVVVDDNSPDGTGKWCITAMEKYDRLHHIGREGKLGLGSATLEGLKFGLKHQFEFIGTMDADFSHNPKSMQEMWHRMQRCDSFPDDSIGAIIGSRYIEGGQIDGWPWYRRIASSTVNRLARIILQLPTKDNTGAFRIYRTQAILQAKAFEINTSGYAYLEEIVFLLARAGFQLQEYPITFVDREKGKSKASIGEGLGVIWNMIQLRRKH